MQGRVYVYACASADMRIGHVHEKVTAFVYFVYYCLCVDTCVCVCAHVGACNILLCLLELRWLAI